MPDSPRDVLERIARIGILSPVEASRLADDFGDMASLSNILRFLTESGQLTQFQADAVRDGRSEALTLGGKYLILDVLGRGGMGCVYKAKSRMLNRVVAVKTIRADLVAVGMTDDEAVSRFRREVEAMGKISHPNFILAHDADKDGSIYYLVMEYVEGEDLHRLVKSGGPLPLEWAARCVLQAALGLEHAHQMKIIHRDVKPNNLMLTRQGLVKVLDLGLARFTESEDGTTTNRPIGTSDYMSPEQCLDATRVDARTDIYALGCTLFYLCAGQPPFGRRPSMANKIHAHLYEQPPSLRGLRPDISPQLEAICIKMMAKRPEDRYQTMAAVSRAIEELGISPRHSPQETIWSYLSPSAGPNGAPADTEDAPITSLGDTGALQTTVNSRGMILVHLPGGDFAMGAAPEEPDACDDEKPRRWTRVLEFRLAIHPTTQEQFQAVMGRNPSWFSPSGNGKHKIIGKETDTHPVERVTWFEAVEFCNRLSALEDLPPYYQIDGRAVTILSGDGYRLPTEREWEYACRAGNSGRYSFGDGDARLADYSWFDLNSGLATHPVRSKLPNRWGLFDLHGNVWEWCWDWYDPQAYGESAPDPNGPATGKRRILRGGAFFDPSHKLRSACRYSEVPEIRLWDFGFRVARSIF